MSKIIHFSDGSRGIVHPQDGKEISLNVKGVTVVEVQDVTHEEAELVKNEITEAIS